MFAKYTQPPTSRNGNNIYPFKKSVSLSVSYSISLFISLLLSSIHIHPSFFPLRHFVPLSLTSHFPIPITNGNFFSDTSIYNLLSQHEVDCPCLKAKSQLTRSFTDIEHCYALKYNKEQEQSSLMGDNSENISEYY